VDSPATRLQKSGASASGQTIRPIRRGRGLNTKKVSKKPRALHFLQLKNLRLIMKNLILWQPNSPAYILKGKVFDLPEIFSDRWTT
jgi:hypothetical protein